MATKPVKVTIQEVARAAGVSVTTVSRVLNDSPNVRPEKRAAVQRAIAELQYSPSRVAQSLKSRSFGVVALIVSDISNAFFAEIARSFERYCDEAGYTLMLCNTDWRQDRLARFLRDLPHRGVDGIIHCGITHLAEPAIRPLVESIASSGPPMVLTGREVEGIDLPTVVTDSVSGVAQALEHLWRTGRRRIAYLSGVDAHQSPIARERLDAFTAIAAERGFTIDPKLIESVGYEFEAGHRAIKRLLAAAPDLDAVLCAADQIAVGVLRGLGEFGRKVPGDVAVVGWDDTKLARYLDPPLTSVSVNLDDIASAATRMLTSAIQGLPAERTTTVACDLIIRASS
ncbi:LacI family DNA-binding transcriptional regulator [Amycolatopsis pithecellobii]|uniref:LacI family DNA-binding transcriptional regulator n=1 Tax=Amycolatopsis pithecellobii TaxID=664692 RepID=UPI00140E86ED|nr:LacI family DNA-binding transcriptional regulator [Amycolatopsis pithecellobii]